MYIEPDEARPPELQAPPANARGFAPRTVLAGCCGIVAMVGRGGMGEVYRAPRF